MVGEGGSIRLFYSQLDWAYSDRAMLIFHFLFFFGALRKSKIQESLEEPGGSRRIQEEPRRSQEEPGGARRSPGGAKEALAPPRRPY